MMMMMMSEGVMMMWVSLEKEWKGERRDGEKGWEGGRERKRDRENISYSFSYSYNWSSSYYSIYLLTYLPTRLQKAFVPSFLNHCFSVVPLLLIIKLIEVDARITGKPFEVSQKQKRLAGEAGEEHVGRGKRKHIVSWRSRIKERHCQKVSDKRLNEN